MEYLMYLRKSRADRDFLDEPIMQTLKRHKARLDEYCQRHGISVKPENILYEVAGADSIALRPMMIELLHRVESGAFTAVLCVDMDRLSRGSGADQSLVINTFKFSDTKIITPAKTYDFNDETDEQFAELGLFIGRNEYRMIKRRLMQGRIDAAKEGKFCTGNAPYGYEVYKLAGQKGYSLKVVPEQAEVVRKMYDMYIDGGLGYKAIAAALNAAGYRSNHGPWTSSHVYKIMSDPTYCGMIRFRYKIHTKAMRGGQVVNVEHRNGDPIISKGLHEPIITEERFQQAAEVKKGRRTPRVKLGFQMANPFCSLVRCAYCGKNLALASADRKGVRRLHCITPGCNNHDVPLNVFEERVVYALGEWLKGYEVHQPVQSMAEKLSAAQTALSALKRDIAKEQAREARIMDLLEQGIYTPEEYRLRIAASRAARADLEARAAGAGEEVERLQKYEEARITIAPRVKTIIEHYYDQPSAKEKNLLLKQVIEFIEYEKESKGRGTEDDFKITLYPRVPQ